MVGFDILRNVVGEPEAEGDRSSDLVCINNKNLLSGGAGGGCS